MKLSRRRFLKLLGLAGGATLAAPLAGCVQTQAPGPTAAPAKPAAAEPAATAAATTGAPAAVSKVSEVAIGVAYPLSGALGPIGVDAKAIIELAVDMINNPGPLAASGWLLSEGKGLPNLGGAKIRAIITDHQGDPARGAGETERLITQEKVAAIYGMYQSAVTATASQVAERLQVPFLAPEASSPALTARNFKWFFRTGPHDYMFSEAMFEFLKDLEKSRGIKVQTVATTYEDTDFGTSSAKAQRELAEKNGYKVVADIQYRAGATSMTTEVQKLKAANPDVWLPTGYVADAGLLVRTAKELDFNPKIVLAQDAGWVDAAFISQVGKQAEGYSSRGVFSPEFMTKVPALQTLSDLLKQKVGHDLTDNPSRQFLGFIVLADAINRAGSTDPEKIRQALVATDVKPSQIPLPWKGVKFDGTGQNTLGSPIMYQLQGGRYWTVWPEQAKAKEFVYPIPPWSQRS